MINSKKLARIRRRVVGSYLSEKGYAVSGKEYFAKVGHQLRYVRFSAAKYGKAFDVNIALHFDFLPPFEFAVWPGAPIPSEMCSELCAFQRLVRNNAEGQYHKYAETEAEAEAMLHDIAVKAAAGLDEIGAICGDGQRLMELITPEVFWADLAIFERLLRADTIEEQNRLSISMRIRQLVPHEWHLHITPTLILLGYLARYHRRADLIPAYLKLAPKDQVRREGSALHRRFTQALDVMARNKSVAHGHRVRVGSSFPVPAASPSRQKYPQIADAPRG